MDIKWEDHDQELKELIIALNTYIGSLEFGAIRHQEEAHDRLVSLGSDFLSNIADRE